MVSPCRKIRIPINEPADPVGSKGQISEFLDAYHGEGIQHVALAAEDIYTTVEQLSGTGVSFHDTPDTYYEAVDSRLPCHGEDIQRLRENRILIDGPPTDNSGLLLQIFTNTVIGPIFFELIQRKGNEGIGEGNFKSLFDSIELDQNKRGVLIAA